MRRTPRRRAIAPPHGGHAPSRRSVLATGTSFLSLAGCSSASSTPAGYSTDEPLLSGGPAADASLRVAGRSTQLQLEAAGQALEGPAFTVEEWVNVGAGPDVIQGFRAGALDISANAIIPPIQARVIGFEASIVAVRERPLPSYVFGTAAGSDITSFADFRGKRIGFSQGQSQGDTVLRTLREAGIAEEEVELIDLPSTQFLTALQGAQVDVAPLGEPEVTKYIAQYGADGANAIPSEVPDLLEILWAPQEVLADDTAVLAVRDYIRVWAQGLVWAWENAEAWKQFYYVETEGVTAADADRIWERISRPTFPTSWDAAIAWAGSSIDLLVDGGFIPESIDPAALFDRRFEGDASAAVDPGYAEAAS